MWSDEWFAHEAAVYSAVHDPRVNAVLDVIAPRSDGGGRAALFEWGHEETPRAEEMVELAENIVAALDGTARLSSR